VESYPYQMKEGYLLSVTVGHFYSGAVLICLRVYAGGFLMATHSNFSLWFLLSSSFYLSFFSSPNLSRCRLDVCNTSIHGCLQYFIHGVALVTIYDADLKCAAHGSLEMQDPKNCQKFAIWAPSHNFVGLYLRN